MPYLNVRGVDHYYRWISASEQSDPDKKPVSGKPVLVFIHGWAGSTRYWESTARSLSDQFDCLLYDMRGFGQSQLPRPLSPEVADLGYELESYVEDLAILLDALDVQKICLNAHSTGASIAVLFLNRYPERVERAVLTCSGVFEYDEKTFKTFHQFSGYVVAFRPAWMLKIPGIDQMFMARFLQQSIPGAAKRAFLEDFIAADYEAAIGTVYTAVSQRASEEMPGEFAQLSVPTLLISGEYDKIIPVQLGQTAAALSDKVEHVVIANTGHFPMLEDAKTYFQHVRPFLQQPDMQSIS